MFYIDAFLVRQLITEQFPQWKNLEIKPVEFGGWDNRTFHLGKNMTVRLPSGEEYQDQVKKEQFWLPKLASFLSMKIPVPLGMGKPTDNYPFNWSIYAWIDGETLSIERIDDLSQCAINLACFLISLQKIDPTNGPKNFGRGSSLLKIYDTEAQWAIKTLGKTIDTYIVSKIWAIALASVWTNPPIWFHGDIAVGNLLVKNGKLSAVIDFGSMGIGDPACDLAIAWTFFQGESRNVFRKALKLDENTWLRGRGWALWKALIVAAKLEGTNCTEIEIKKSKKIIDEIVADYSQKN